MAAGGGPLGAWRNEERARREAKAAVEAWERRVEQLAGRRWPGWPSMAGGGTAQRRRQGKQASKLEEGEKGPNCNFQKFQGPECKPVITFNLRLK